MAMQADERCTERLPSECYTLPLDAKLTDAIALVLAGAPLVLVVDAGGRLAGVIDALAVRVAHVSGDAASTSLSALMQPSSALRTGAGDEQTSLDEQANRDQPGKAGASPSPRTVSAPVLSAAPVVDEDGCPVAIEVQRASAGFAQAVVMAGGLGKRLRPLTETTPKPLLEVSGSSLLERMLVHLEEHGVARSVVSVGYLAEQVEAFVAGGGRWTHAVECLREPEALGTAGVLGLLGERTDGPFFLVNGDIVTSADLTAMAGHHLASRAAVTVATVPYEWRIPYGVVDPEGRRVAAVREKPLYRFETNAGLYAFDPSVAAELPAGQACDMVELINRLAEAGRTVARFPLVEPWSDVGRPDDFTRVQDEVAPLA